MPYDRAKYRHVRYTNPKHLIPATIKTVPISHTEARRKYPYGTIARVGKSRKTQNWVIQSVLIPKN